MSQISEVTRAEEDTDEVAELDYTVVPRARTSVELMIPNDLLATLQEIADEEGIGLVSLLRSYISNGVLADMERRRVLRLLARAESIVAQHVESLEEAHAILNELREAAEVQLPGSRRRAALQPAEIVTESEPSR